MNIRRKYTTIYKLTAETNELSTTVLPTLTGITALGCICFCNCTLKLFQKMMILSVFNPPDVDPEQAHCIERNTRISIESDGQQLVSAVAKPVVVMMDTTWNIESLNDCNQSVYMPAKYRLMAIATPENRMTPA